MRKTGKKKPPSRAKYEQAHPTVSFRVDRESYDRCKQGKNLLGMSFADIFKAGAGIIEPRIKEEGDMRGRIFVRGLNQGHSKAEALYKVTYPCSICRKTITVTSDAEKQAIKRYMRENGWGHKECHDRRR